jgi:hypothetical protein
MRVVLDEDVAVQVLVPLRHVLRSHQVDHVEDLNWKSKRTTSSSRTPARRSTTCS